MITTDVKIMKNFIGDKWVESSSGQMENVPNPATGETIAHVPISGEEDVDAAVAAAKSAYEEWHTVPVPNRTRYLFKYLQLLEENKEELAQILTQENGKALNDSRGEVQRGIEVVEHATSTPNLMLGDALPSIATGIDGSIRSEERRVGKEMICVVVE